MRWRLGLVVVAMCLTAGWFGWRHGWPGGHASASPPSVLLVSIDTLRADHIGSYGYRSAATPVIDALQARGRSVGVSSGDGRRFRSWASSASRLRGCGTPRWASIFR